MKSVSRDNVAEMAVKAVRNNIKLPLMGETKYKSLVDNGDSKYVLSTRSMETMHFYEDKVRYWEDVRAKNAFVDMSLFDFWLGLTCEFSVRSCETVINRKAHEEGLKLDMRLYYFRDKFVVPKSPDQVPTWNFNMWFQMAMQTVANMKLEAMRWGITFSQYLEVRGIKPGTLTVYDTDLPDGELSRIRSVYTDDYHRREGEIEVAAGLRNIEKAGGFGKIEGIIHEI
jgi:hypothetical protein